MHIVLKYCETVRNDSVRLRFGTILFVLFTKTQYCIYFNILVFRESPKSSGTFNEKWPGNQLTDVFREMFYSVHVCNVSCMSYTFSFILKIQNYCFL